MGSLPKHLCMGKIYASHSFSTAHTPRYRPGNQSSARTCLRTRGGTDGPHALFPDETDLFLNIFSEDEDGELLLEYSTAVPAATQSITLPASLTGTFVIEVIRADQHFQGEIEL